MARQKPCIGAAIVSAPAIPCMPTAYAPSTSFAKLKSLGASRNSCIHDDFLVFSLDKSARAVSCMVSNHLRSVFALRLSHALAGESQSGRAMRNGSLFGRAPVGDTPMRSSRARCLSSSEPSLWPQASRQVTRDTNDSRWWL
jgi:hypothetical protein